MSPNSMSNRNILLTMHNMYTDIEITPNIKPLFIRLYDQKINSLA